MISNPQTKSKASKDDIDSTNSPRQGARSHHSLIKSISNESPSSLSPTDIQHLIAQDVAISRRFSEPSLSVPEAESPGWGISSDPAESRRRGRSFGPLPKTGSSQQSKGGILKGAPPSPLQKKVSPHKDDRSRSHSPQGHSPSHREDTDGAQDSDDEEHRERGRKRTIGSLESASKPPVISTSPPPSEASTSKNFVIKPKTSFDKSNSRERGRSPTATDYETLEEIRSAQRLGITISTTETPESHRAVRTLIRGDFGYFQTQAKDGKLRLRTYLLAANLKQEAAYAVEWALGTVLRDGDTLMVVFAIDKDAETGLPSDGLGFGEGGKAMQETTAEVDEMTKAAIRKPSILKSFLPKPRKSSVTADARNLGKPQERTRALERLSELCIGLLRKTKLQVRVVIEIIHCKNARYMLTEAIDVLQPTLVIVGSRGRSAMKGALAGSFSRYLIMKSSVPVMTARMKLSGRKVGSSRPIIRLANNLVPSKRLADAKIDELESKLSMRQVADDDADV